MWRLGLKCQRLQDILSEGDSGREGEGWGSFLNTDAFMPALLRYYSSASHFTSGKCLICCDPGVLGSSDATMSTLSFRTPTDSPTR